MSEITRYTVKIRRGNEPWRRANGNGDTARTFATYREAALDLESWTRMFRKDFGMQIAVVKDVTSSEVMLSFDYDELSDLHNAQELI